MTKSEQQSVEKTILVAQPIQLVAHRLNSLEKASANARQKNHVKRDPGQRKSLRCVLDGVCHSGFTLFPI